MSQVNASKLIIQLICRHKIKQKHERLIFSDTHLSFMRQLKKRPGFHEPHFLGTQGAAEAPLPPDAQ
jgi:hypothetical protein